MVIQRWQSVLLLIATIFMAIFSFSSLCEIKLEGNSFILNAFGIENLNDPEANQSVYYLFGLSLLSAILSLIAIFMYRNTRFQKILCRINMLIMLAVYAVVMIIPYNSFAGADVVWSLSIVFPAIAMISTFVAHRLIVSDENKLKSYDRIR